MCRKLIYLISFALVLGLTLTTTASADLVGWWRFDDGSGATAVDSSGNGNDGVLEGGAQWVAGQLSGAIEFNGSNAYVRAPHIPLDSRSFTIAMWVNPVLYTDQQVVFGQHESGSGNLSMHLRLGGPGGTIPNPGAVRMGFYSNDLDTAGGLIEDNNWYHIAFWYDSESQTRRIYIDGVQAAEDNASPYLGTSGDTRIGQWNNNQWFQGIIDDVQIYNHPLTQVEIQAVMRGLEGYPYAGGPAPADGSLYAATWASLTWKAGDFVVSHNVYMGTNFADVDAGTGGTFLDNVPENNVMDPYLIVGIIGYPMPEGLVPDTTYYWRVDEVNDADPNSPWKGNVWSFTIPPKKAYDPVPGDVAGFVDADVTLTWTAGFGARTHAVYFGDDFDTVNNATGAPGLPFTTFTPSGLEPDKTYYWRVDETDEVFAVHKGDVWSFRTLPDIPITDPNLVGWWKLDEGAGDLALDWSGHGNHGTVQGNAQWVDGYDGAALEFNGSNARVDAPYIPLDSRSFTITMWINPVLYTNEQVVFSQVQSNATDTSMHFRLGGPNIGGGNVAPRGVRMGFYGNDLDTPGGLIEDNTRYHITFWYDFESQNRRIYVNGVQQAEAAATPYLGTSGNTVIGSWGSSQWFRGIIGDVRIYNKALTQEEIKQTMRGDPLLAWDPSPTNGSTPDTDHALPLSWSPGEKAAQHDVYFGTDEDAVRNADASDTTGIYRGRQSGTGYTPGEGVEWGGGPYYWRIDEYNTDATISKGRVWNFTAADFMGIDNMEDYDLLKQIWWNWLDGLGYVDLDSVFHDGNGSGSEVGDPDTPSTTEETIVHGGGQSMPYWYNNSGSTGKFNYSEAKLTLSGALRDWSEENVKALSLWFQGYSASVGSFVESPPGTYTMTGSGADIWNNGPVGDRHDEFHYAYKMLNSGGTIIAKVESVLDTDVWAKAGVMIRETLEGGSPHAFICVTPGSGVAAQGRPTAGADSFNVAQGGITAPHWVRLER
ncbi:MAG: LamG domain-containing protein, partial [Planctomycetota bacterium]